MTAIDGSKWHVLEDSGSDSQYVTLLSDYNLNIDGTYNTQCNSSNRVCNPMTFDSDNTNTYDENDTNNIGYFIKNTYSSLVDESLVGTIEVSLPTAIQLSNVDGINFDASSSNAFKLDSSWLLSTYYWTRTAYSSNATHIWYVGGSNGGLNLDVANDKLDVRPVITTLKTNLLAK